MTDQSASIYPEALGKYPRIQSFEAAYCKEWGFTMTLYFESKEDFILMLKKLNEVNE